MRLWHYKLLPYLPEAQFKGQLRELIAIMRAWKRTGTVNHLLVRRVTLYSKSELYAYWLEYAKLYKEKFGKSLDSYTEEFFKFQEGSDYDESTPLFHNWHDRKYLRVCMANLYEKHKYGLGSSRISIEEWETLLFGYSLITGEYYVI